MKRILTFLLLALCCLSVTAETVQNGIDIDALIEHDGLLLSQNTPNPFDGTTEVLLAVVHPGEVMLVTADINGHLNARTSAYFESGIHRLRITQAAKGTCVLGAQQGSRLTSVVMLCTHKGPANRIEYAEFVEPIDESLFVRLLDEDKDEDYIGYAIVNTVQTVTTDEPFRVALSLSPFSLNQFEQGYTFRVGNKTASSPAQLQQIYRDLGSTEMYVRIATKRHKTATNTTDGQPDENANVHTFDQALTLCRLAASLNIPINPEIMCAYTYMDMDGTQAPRFEEYPSIYALQKGKKWEELTLEEICTVLEAYGEFVADSILATGCTVVNWNLGNEANFGFAGIGIGTPNAFDQTLAAAGAMKRYMSSLFSLWWLKKHVWKYEAQTLAAVRRGVLKAYGHYPALDASKVKFSTHIATVVSTPRSSAAFFTYMAENGYPMETAGISYYPSAPAMSLNKKKLLTKTVTRINKKCKIPVFIGEFSYPSGPMEGPFAGWNSQLGDYEKNQQGQADIYADVIAWGKTHGMCGIRYWAPDYKGWYSMSMFEFDENHVGTAKQILLNHQEIVE